MALVVKSLPANAGDEGSIPGSGRSPGRGDDSHSCILAWRILAQRATVHGVAEPDTTEPT